MCTRCGNDCNDKICSDCKQKFLDARTKIFAAVENKLGKHTFDNHKAFNKEFKRLENWWLKDEKRFNREISK